MGLRRDIGLARKMVDDAVASRRAQVRIKRVLASRPPLDPGHFRIGVYFADPKVNLYQLRQWYAPLVELSKRWPVLILTRASGTALTLFDESPLPVAYVRQVSDLEQVIDSQPLQIVFYVNQNPRNFQMMRYGRRWHVFINHGESDKMYMTTNQFKAYDYALIAGEAALARLRGVLWDYDFDKRAIQIGRPQADHLSGALPYQPDGREVVLYAPTWEGDRAGAAYGSIVSHGLDLVTALISTGRHRVIYRPHPRSGIMDDAYRAANREIVHRLEAANRADPQAQHIHDTGSELGWQLSAADVAIVDISAMVYDRLATGKPLLVTRPVNPAAEVDVSGYLQACEWLEAADASNITARIDAVANDEDAKTRLQYWVRRYFGDTTPGAATERFHTAVDHLMSEWERFAALHAETD